MTRQRTEKQTDRLFLTQSKIQENVVGTLLRFSCFHHFFRLFSSPFSLLYHSLSLSAFWSKLCLFHLPSSESFGRRTTVFLPRVRSSQRASCIRSVVEPTRKVLATTKLRLRLEDAYPCLVCFVVYFGFAKDNYRGSFCQMLRKERQHPYFWNRISYEKEAQLSDSVLRKER